MESKNKYPANGRAFAISDESLSKLDLCAAEGLTPAQYDLWLELYDEFGDGRFSCLHLGRWQLNVIGDEVAKAMTLLVAIGEASKIEVEHYLDAYRESGEKLMVEDEDYRLVLTKGLMRYRDNRNPTALRIAAAKAELDLFILR